MAKPDPKTKPKPKPDPKADPKANAQMALIFLGKFLTFHKLLIRGGHNALFSKSNYVGKWI